MILLSVLHRTLFLLAIVACTHAHGYVKKLKIGGKSYPGYEPTIPVIKTASVIRAKSSTSPVLASNLSSPDLACGPDARHASLTATAAAGDTIQLFLASTEAPAFAWFHNVGPLLTYLTDCGESCTDLDATQAKWFKIDQQAKDPGGEWMQALLYNNNKAFASVVLPSNLKPGNYILRHEIIALQNGKTLGEAELYPSCSHLTVTGTGTGAPTADELVLIRNAYKATDPGIKVDVYTDPSKPYKFPGPPVAAFVSEASPTAPSSSTAEDDTPTSPSSSTAGDNTPTPSSSSTAEDDSTLTPSATSSDTAVASTSAASTGQCLARRRSRLRRRKH
ncbi:glycosyl hydrolase family 61-domain-containing protein [Mycena filopes]|nr:glycosyl hydrolase family 61-domain-containing protein [Mycena filopes]